MISNADFLIQKYAEAQEKMNNATTYDTEQYWRGAMDTYHSLLNLAFEDWSEKGTTGYFVFTKEMTYDEALNAVNQFIH